jgi:hypothetical protein
MKNGFLVVVMTLLAGLTLTAAVQAAQPDEALCRGDYPVMLMTKSECRLYVRQVQALLSAGKTQALAILQQQHAEQLKERAPFCPCMEHSLEGAAPQQVAILAPDC